MNSDEGVTLYDNNGRPHIVCEGDLPLVSALTSLRVAGSGYVYVRQGRSRFLLHRLILNLTDPTIHVDHINQVKYDNRRSNLRTATLAQNNRNGSLRKNNSSGFKGVYFDKVKKKWAAGIGLNSTRVALGRYDTPEEAALAYDEAARLHYGEFAYLNYPKKGENGLGHILPSYGTNGSD